jgi:glycosyltransferase involved in cell wall biosynthesis
MQNELQKPPHLLIIANSCWNIYNFRLNLIQSLLDHGFKVSVLAPADEYTSKLRAMPDFSLHLLKNLHAQQQNPFKDLFFFWELKRLFRQLKPDFALGFTIKPNLFGSLAAKSLGIPFLPTVTGLGYTFLREGWLNKLVIRLYRMAFRDLQAVALHNESDLRLLQKLNILAPGQGISVPGSGVDTQKFAYAPIPSRLPFVFLFLGRLLRDKGLVELAEAAAHVKARHKQVEFWIAGSNEVENPAAISKQELQTWIDQGVFKYFGQVEDVRPLLTEAHAVVLPSYREGMPRAILEAMSMGRPVIVTNVPGCREAVPLHQCGLWAPPRDAEALAAALEQMVQMGDEQLLNMSLDCRNFALQRFSCEAVEAVYLQLIAAQLALPRLVYQNKFRQSQEQITIE